MIRANAPKYSPPGADFCSGRHNAPRAVGTGLLLPPDNRKSGARKETDKELVGLVEVLA